MYIMDGYAMAFQTLKHGPEVQGQVYSSLLRQINFGLSVCFPVASGLVDQSSLNVLSVYRELLIISKAIKLKLPIGDPHEVLLHVLSLKAQWLWNFKTLV